MFTYLSEDIKFPKQLKEFNCPITLLPITTLHLTVSHHLYDAISFVFCTDTVKPCSVIVRFNLYAACYLLSKCRAWMWTAKDCLTGYK
jgi:hypothetical protein